MSNSFQAILTSVSNEENKSSSNKNNNSNINKNNNNNNNDTDSRLNYEESTLVAIEDTKSIETNSDESNHAIGSPPPVVVRRERLSRKDEDSSSSSLNEDQLIYLDKILGSSADIETSADELESNQRSDNSVNRNDESILSFTDEMKSISCPVKPKVPPKPTNLLKKHESLILLKANRTAIHSEYVQLCKIGASNANDNLDDENNEIKTINNDFKANRNWQRIFLIYYSDFTIGVYSNQNVNKICFCFFSISEFYFFSSKRKQLRPV